VVLLAVSGSAVSMDLVKGMATNEGVAGCQGQRYGSLLGVNAQQASEVGDSMKG